MGAFSIWHWVIVILVLLLPGYPIARILGRLGFSKWWVIVAFITPFNLIALWVLAYARWPAEGAPNYPK